MKPVQGAGPEEEGDGSEKDQAERLPEAEGRIPEPDRVH